MISLGCWVGLRSRICVERMYVFMYVCAPRLVPTESFKLKTEISHAMGYSFGPQEALGRVLVLGGPFYTPQFLSHVPGNNDISGKKCLW